MRSLNHLFYELLLRLRWQTARAAISRRPSVGRRLAGAAADRAVSVDAGVDGTVNAALLLRPLLSV